MIIIIRIKIMTIIIINHPCSIRFKKITKEHEKIDRKVFKTH